MDCDLDALKAQHGEIYELAVDLGEDGGLVTAIVRRPGRAQFARFSKDGMSDPMRAMHNLFFDCLVHPAASEMQRLFERYPGLLMAFANRLLGMAKANLEVLEKKL
ncbi:hypothetical protein KBD49_13275 [Myxococcota bacterium]|jgi:hypothetical protein|nr:hypothetical protein [Myxococcota bacterium]